MVVGSTMQITFFKLFKRAQILRAPKRLYRLFKNAEVKITTGLAKTNTVQKSTRPLSLTE